MIEEKKQRKNKVIKVIALLGLFLMVFGISYALFKVTLNGNKTNRIKTGKFSLKITDKNGNEETNGYGINLEDGLAVPMSALDALDTIEPYEFNIVNNGDYPIDYKLYLEVPDTSDLPANKIKYNLERTDLNEFISQVLTTMECDVREGDCAEPEHDSSLSTDEIIERSLKESATNLLSNAKVRNEENSKLYTIDLGVIGAGQTHKYALKFWIAYAAGTEISNKSFEGIIKVDGVQAKKDAAYKLLYYRGFYADATVYSDGSLVYNCHFDFDETTTNDDIMAMVIKYNLYKELNNDSFLNDINTLLASYSIDPYDSILPAIDIAVDSMFGLNVSDGTYTDEIVEAITELVNQKMEDSEIEDDRLVYVPDLYIKGYVRSLSGNHDGMLPFIVRNVHISDIVTSIESNAFYGNFESIDFVHFEEDEKRAPNEKRLEIKSYAFKYNGARVTLPSYTKYIAQDAFIGCNEMELIINAKRSDVTYNESTLANLKSVTWINN